MEIQPRSTTFNKTILSSKLKQRELIPSNDSFENREAWFVATAKQKRMPEQDQTQFTSEVTPWPVEEMRKLTDPSGVSSESQETQFDLFHEQTLSEKTASVATWKNLLSGLDEKQETEFPTKLKQLNLLPVFVDIANPEYAVAHKKRLACDLGSREVSLNPVSVHESLLKGTNTLQETEKIGAELKAQIEKKGAQHLFDGMSANEKASFLKALGDINLLQDLPLHNVDLSGIYLADADLSGANLQGANLSGSYFSDVHFEGTNLRDADLRDVSFETIDHDFANLTNVVFEGANLSGARINRAGLLGANLKNVTGLNTQITKSSLIFADLTDAVLAHSDFIGNIVSGADLRRTDFSNANLMGSDFQGANYFETVNIDGAITGYAYNADRSDTIDTVFPEEPTRISKRPGSNVLLDNGMVARAFFDLKIENPEEPSVQDVEQLASLKQKIEKYEKLLKEQEEEQTDLILKEVNDGDNSEQLDALEEQMTESFDLLETSRSEYDELIGKYNGLEDVRIYDLRDITQFDVS